MMDQFFPCRFFISECLQNGQLPLWSPYINYGYPFHADPQSGAFYPVTWIISLFGGYTVYTIAIEYLLHIFIAGISFYALLRQFKITQLTATIFGVIYALSGIFISNAQHLTWVVSMAWMPLVLFAFYRLLHYASIKNALAFALIAYLFMTGGYPGFAIILFYFLVVYGVLRFVQLLNNGDGQAIKKSSVAMAVGGIVFVLISSGFFYSIIQAMPDIARSKPVTLEEANSIAFTPPAALSILFPFVNSSLSYSYHTNTDISMTNAYMGVLFFPMFILGLWKMRRNWFQVLLLVFATICLLAALGDVTPVRSWMYSYLPGMNVFRHAAIFRAITVLSFLSIAAVGFDWMMSSATASKRRIVVSCLLALLFFLSGVIISIWVKENSTLQWLSRLDLTAISGFNQVASASSHVLVQASYQWIIVALFLMSYLLVKITYRKCLMGLLLLLEISFAAYLNLPSTVVSDVAPKTLQAELNKYPKGFPIPSLTPVGDFEYVSNISTAPIWFNISFFKKIPSWGGFNNFYPKGMDDVKETSTEEFIWQQPIVFTSDSTVNKTIEITQFAPGNIQLHYTSAKAINLVLLQSYFKGWEASCDNRLLSLSKVYLNFMQCEVPAGSHEVTYVYKPKHLYLFVGLGLLSLFVSTFVWLFLMGKKTRNA